MEPTEKKYGVFISYSHEDTKFVSPIVDLIKATRSDLVFQDTRDLIRGKKWEPQLIKALQQAEIVIVFWCEHSSSSEYVQKEYKAAITQNKDVLPVLLDDCKLIQDLAAYQWIDFKNIISHQNDKDARPLNTNIFKKYKTAFLAIIVFVATITFLSTFIYKNYNAPDPTTNESSFNFDSLNYEATIDKSIKNNKPLRLPENNSTSSNSAKEQPITFPDPLDSSQEVDRLEQILLDSINKSKTDSLVLENQSGSGGGGGGSSRNEEILSENEVNVPIIILAISLISTLLAAIWSELNYRKKRHKKILDTKKIVSEIQLKLHEKLPLNKASHTPP